MDRFCRQLPSTSSCILEDKFKFFQWFDSCLQLANSLDLYQVGPQEDEIQRPFLPAVWTVMAMVGLSSNIKILFDVKFAVTVGNDRLFDRGTFQNFLLDVKVVSGNC